VERRLIVLLDTSALLFYSINPDRLTARASDAIESADVLFVSSISFWEIGIKQKSGKLELPLELDTFVERMNQACEIQILPVDLQVWMGNVHLDWAHRDPADRTIVATGQLISVPIVTSDKRIQEFYPDTIW
jgi:PIN domain nuclease of toxin-antitoxin system